MKNIPSKIFLQVGEDVDNQDDFRDLGEVTWCEDMIFDTDIEYTRHIASYSELSELVKAICWLRDQHVEAYQEALGLHGEKIFDSSNPLMLDLSELPDNYLRRLIEVWRKKTTVKL